ncbi:MAG TPA: hypothetical protein VHU23_11890 [Rhizomicrobium sp.]|nr:hypothetical protein [Rhizomicrobium sp.]
MEVWNSIVQSMQSESWGGTPLTLAAPFGLLTMAFMARRFAREKGPKTESSDIAGIAFIALIIAAAFFFVYQGLALLEISFR